MSPDDNTVPVNRQEPASGAPFPAASSESSSAKADGVAHAKGNASGHGQKHHIWLVTGPAGCCKTAVAKYLAHTLDVPYIEGDSFHTEAGVPLTDADRWDRLTALRDESTHRISRGSEGVVVACSALKRKYRDVIRVAGYYDRDILVHFIVLDAPAEVLRQGHYMGADMVESQFDIVERPAHDERDVISIDVSRGIEQVKQDALARVFDIVKADH